VVLVKGEQVGIVGIRSAGGAAAVRLLPAGPGRPGRAAGWRPREAAGRAGLLSGITNLVARLSDLDYTRLYGRYKTCSDCGTDYSQQRYRCPGCRSSHSLLIDRTGRLPAMLTLTYPGEWLTVAPDAEAIKRHFWALCKRYERAWGEPLIGLWKLEFQRRGAPHFHISTVPPMGFVEVFDPDAGRVRSVEFRTWLSITWAEIVAHPDPEQRDKHRLAGTGVDYAEGIKLTDPRRMAVYFAKYGTAGGKEYQHRIPDQWCQARLRCDDCGAEYDEHSDDPCAECGSDSAYLISVPSGTGRFWGYRGLRSGRRGLAGLSVPHGAPVGAGSPVRVFGRLGGAPFALTATKASRRRALRARKDATFQPRKSTSGGAARGEAEVLRRHHQRQHDSGNRGEQ
jgi:hypothetical protein